jgi:3-hydroxy-9,10-secoandrosta-1,3,5(10)-triene-9,17-dione monooxygenase
MTSTQLSGSELVSNARDLVPLLRSRAEPIDDLRRLPDDVVAAFEQAGLFRLQAPSQYGGYETSVRTVVDVCAEVARGNGSAAFCLSAYTVATWNACLWPDVVLDKVFATENVRISGTTAPTGKAVRTEGGYRLSGTWKFNSGAPHAHWDVLAAMPVGSDNDSVPVFCLLPMSDLEIVDNWYSTGLQGSASVTVKAHDVFVAEEFVLDVASFGENGPKSEANAQKSHYRLPPLVAGAAFSMGQLVGTAEYALETFLERLPGRPITYTHYTSQLDAPITHHQVAEAALLIEDARVRGQRFADRIDEKAAAGEAWTIDERVWSRTQVGWIARQCAQAVDILAMASGASSILKDVPISRIHRDMQALTLHALILPSTNLELYGRSLVGLPPNTNHL